MAVNRLRPSWRKVVNLFTRKPSRPSTLVLNARKGLKQFTRRAQDCREKHTNPHTHQVRVEGSTCHPTPVLPSQLLPSSFCAHGAATEELGKEDWFGTKGTAPVAKATARSEGQQREQSWIPDLGPAATSRTMACGLVL